MDPMRFIGRSVEQVDAFVANEIEPRVRGAASDGLSAEIRV
jgi:hypothetical protein